MPKMTNPLAGLGDSIKRTIVPFLTAWLVAKAAHSGVKLDASGVNATLVLVGGSVWYVIVRVAEEKWPIIGKALGSAKTPTYAPKAS